MKKIVQAQIHVMRDPIAALMAGWSGTGRVQVKYALKDEWQDLFYYYTDELGFDKSEFIGLTEDQARRLYYDKDVAYLRS